ncbi:NAD(P)/FAD-dependent oxidoreductase [Jeotgalibacillus haloalkalitolerans]|uniref:FAD-dependent oxidoreductase n=1 Tax=Jeotgalibacillus haloalkalitolerans TaxID=3104292 RepID=A0ABU5KHN5_9BACL|nr:FAD-dependent oxidoreductase [Jeotgalibacillus sp. HH7-29]MDZ5710653.1 FAD-dependent oxidoreductase [Jeotgalibacillus sp. HH7-29]
MKRQTGTYYWPTTFPDAPAYPLLETDLSCDVLIVGGGSSGAQCAYYLADHDLDTVVIEKSRIASGSTATNTALLQYSGEKMFTRLVNTFGEEYIARHLQLLKEAINEIEAASKSSSIDCEFTRRDTLYSASCPEDVDKLRKEYKYLKQHDCEVTFLEKDEIEAKYPFSREAAIYSYNDGEINPFTYTHALFEEAVAQGVRVYEHTEMNGQHFDQESGHMIVTTKNGYAIEARRVIFAAGYEGLDIKNEKKASFESTFTVTTKPVDDLSAWYNRTLLWETARPYLYLRTTQDNRVIIGGLDENTDEEGDRNSKLIHKKYQLIEEFNTMFPTIRVEPEFYLASSYGGIVDGVPVVGKYEEFPGGYFVFAFGDNGMVYGQALAKLVAEEIVNGNSADLSMYLQDRPLLKKV